MFFFSSYEDLRLCETCDSRPQSLTILLIGSSTATTKNLGLNMFLVPQVFVLLPFGNSFIFFLNKSSFNGNLQLCIKQGLKFSRTFLR